jgi:hypothetical protein
VRTKWSTCLLMAVCILGNAIVSRAQSTTTCPAGQWDMADVVMMDQNLRNANYHLEGLTTTPSDPTGVKNYLAESIPNTNNGSTGKLQYVKTYQPVKGLNGNYGYPWDINLYDQSYIYLWVTEQTWSEPWAYKKFNSGSNDYSMQLARRCVLPGDGQTSLIIVPPPTVNSTNNTHYIIQPKTYTDSPSDCTAASSSSDLKYARMEVQAPQNNFYFYDDVHGTQGDITVVPIYYDYSCVTGNGTNGDCKYREIFTYNNTYGWVQWDYYMWDATKGMWAWQKTSVHNHLKPNDGNSGIYFPCF